MSLQAAWIKIRSLIDNETTDNGVGADDMDVEQAILEVAASTAQPVSKSNFNIRIAISFRFQSVKEPQCDR